MKKIFKVLSVIGIIVVAIFVIQGVWLSGIEVGEDDISGYAAAFAVIDKNEGRSEEEMKKTAENYLKKKVLFGSRDLFCRILDHIYGINEMPVVYDSIPALKSGIEESLVILADYDQLMNGKSAPTMEGYTSEDFYRLLSERIAAEEAILNELNNDASPDLYQYALKLYQTRDACPVVY